ncbi:HIT domain-containing protein [Candidatus Pacearchaeota archaeon]|nr:HIT domain-containing protein [Candidatus Pacearchaeota archaeon]
MDNSKEKDKMLSEQQAEAIKKQIIQQIKATFPEDKKAFAVSQIQGMSPGQLIEFLKKNKMVSKQGAKQLKQLKKQPSKKEKAGKTQAKAKTKPQVEKAVQATTGSAPSQCIFCSIVNKEMPSYQIDENKSCIAVLEINPISKGHTLIIPKEHISSKDKLPQQAFSLAKKISRKLKSKLKKPKPQDVEIAFTNMFGHEIVNVFPVYKGEKISSGRYKEDEKVLKKLEKKLKKRSRKKSKKKKSSKSKKKKKSKKTGKTQSKKSKPKLWLPKRIP